MEDPGDSEGSEEEEKKVEKPATPKKKGFFSIFSKGLKCFDDLSPKNLKCFDRGASAAEEEKIEESEDKEYIFLIDRG